MTNFGKLMDPLADKLLIVAALISLVSLHRLAAWVAMVIIARELAVTVLRMGANQAGVVIAASNFAKVKTCVQIAVILAVITVRHHPLWLELLVYAMVAITVASGLDYFFGLRRRIEQARDRRRRARRQPSSQARIVVCAGECSPPASSRRSSPSVPWRSASTLCWWIVSRFSWRAEMNALSASCGSPRDHAGDHLAHAVLDEARPRVGAATTAASSERFISS